MTEDVQECLGIFFNRTIENSINDQMMEYSYVFPYEKMKDYVMKLCSISYVDYLDYLDKICPSFNITSEDITQISNFKSCEIDFCKKLSGVRRALTSIDVGVILQNDGIVREDGANNKYGENHAKGALQLGLAQKRYGYWYLSCLGKLYPTLNVETREALIARTILRNNLYAALLMNLRNHDTCLENIWESSGLTEKTKVRRRPSVKIFLLHSINQAYKEGFVFSNELDFSIGKRREVINVDPNSSEEERNMKYYKRFIDCVVTSKEGIDHIIAILVLVKATIDYVTHYPGFQTVKSKLSLLGTWEGTFINMLPNFLGKKRKSTLFSTPFIILSRMSFWKVIDANGEKTVLSGRAIKTFANLCEQCEYVEVDQEFVDIINNIKEREEFINYVNKKLERLINER